MFSPTFQCVHTSVSYPLSWFGFTFASCSLWSISQRIPEPRVQKGGEEGSGSGPPLTPRDRGQTARCPRAAGRRSESSFGRSVAPILPAGFVGIPICRFLAYRKSRRCESNDTPASH